MDTLTALDGTRWFGSAELWLDPHGNEAQLSKCAIAVDGETVSYTWTYEGTPQSGRIVLGADDAQFSDTWHQPEPMACRRLPGAPGLFQVQGAYGPDGDWGWRIGLFQRPTSNELVLQMTNVTSWGEEARAVRMVCKLDE